MFHILGILFFLAIFVVLFGLGIVLRIVMSLMGIFRPRKQSHSSYSSQRSSNETESSSSSKSTNGSVSNGRKKIFGDDEGEYVDFEEVND
jgi:predicted lipid-binding transport protein (Tim44 family)